MASLDKRYENLRSVAQRRVTACTLVPGVSYRMFYYDSSYGLTKDFTVEAAGTLHLKDITMKTRK
jgi:hypothetical protein